MDADFRMTGEEMDGEEEELETGFGRDLIIRRMIGELPTCWKLLQQVKLANYDQPTLLLVCWDNIHNTQIFVGWTDWILVESKSSLGC